LIFNMIEFFAIGGSAPDDPGMGVGHSAISQVRKIKTESPRLFNEVAAGTTSLNDAYRQVRAQKSESRGKPERQQAAGPPIPPKALEALAASKAEISEARTPKPGDVPTTDAPASEGTEAPSSANSHRDDHLISEGEAAADRDLAETRAGEQIGRLRGAYLAALCDADLQQRMQEALAVIAALDLSLSDLKLTTRCRRERTPAEAGSGRGRACSDD
jgi:hypothetical protein